MKRIVPLLLLLCLCTSVFASLNPIVDISPYFMFDNSPAGIAEGKNAWKTTSGLQNADWWETKQDYWVDAFSRPAFMNLGFELDTDNVDMVVTVDVLQDIFSQIRDHESIYTNTPFLNGANVDLTFPRVGYVDYVSSNGVIYLSLGRRQIKWGPGTYGFALSDAQPFLDNLYANIDSPIGKGWNFSYDFTAIAFKHYLNKSVESDGAPQTTFAHRFSFDNHSFRISFTELNNIYGKVPTLVDGTPIALWHNNFQDDCSNVMVDMALEGRIGPVRAFGSIAMDDFSLSGETNNQPTAIGVSAGMEWNVVEGEAFLGKDFSNSRYAIKDDTFHVDGGLNMAYEFYYCSTFMYNRSVSGGKFTSNFQINTNVGPGKFYDDDAFFLGFQYGPGTMLHMVCASYEQENLKVEARGKLLMRGSYYIDSTYPSSDYDALALPGDVTTTLMVGAACEYCLQPGLKLSASLDYIRDLTHSTDAFKATAGVSMALCEIDWKNLF